LSARLDLVDLKADAAVWNLKLTDIPRESDDFNNFHSNDTTKGSFCLCSALFLCS
jgi:hypothetical protein